MQITFDGERTVKGLYRFLKKNAAIPFALPKPTKPKPSNSLKDEL
jgi:protein disulfide-isomerase A1